MQGASVAPRFSITPLITANVPVWLAVTGHGDIPLVAMISHLCVHSHSHHNYLYECHPLSSHFLRLHSRPEVEAALRPLLC